MESLVFKTKKDLFSDSTQIPYYPMESLSVGTWWNEQELERYKNIGRVTTIWSNLLYLPLVILSHKNEKI